MENENAAVLHLLLWAVRAEWVVKGKLQDSKQSICNGYLVSHFTKSSEIFSSHSFLEAQAIPPVLPSCLWEQTGTAELQSCLELAGSLLPVTAPDASKELDRRSMLAPHTQELKSSPAPEPAPSWWRQLCTGYLFGFFFTVTTPPLSAGAFQSHQAFGDHGQESIIKIMTL